MLDRTSALSLPQDVVALKALAAERTQELAWPELIAKHRSVLIEAHRIRCVEEGFLTAFNAGLMNGTVHTCIGQEFSAVCIAENLVEGDWITSNHRCHGHFIAKTGEWRPLIDELLGKETGVCRGVGSSQHLYRPGFISNGPQGALLPVGTGIAHKIRGRDNVVVSFIGEGTLGEGVTYEALNLAALLHAPQVFVVENNFYSQSTPQSANLSGGIVDRLRAFGVTTFVANTWDLEELRHNCAAAISWTREHKLPVAIVIATYRLKAHSKGDDDRDREEIDFFVNRDILGQARMQDSELSQEFAEIEASVAQHFEDASKLSEWAKTEYVTDQLPRKTSARYVDVQPYASRVIERINAYLKSVAAEQWLVIGEDVADPYGGAFKATKGVSSQFPESVVSTPISEAGLVGVAAGFTLAGGRAVAEIMFGDFVTYGFDQIVNGASKYHHMYGRQTDCPLIVRLPMGGKRGYGATHSQSLEKFLCGVDNVLVIALTSLCDPMIQLQELKDLACPALVIENKLEYGRRFPEVDPRLIVELNQGTFGHVRISPRYNPCHLTVITYGETARVLLDAYERISRETDSVFEIYCLVRLHPLDMREPLRSAARHGRVLLIEDGSVHFGISAEMAAQLVEGGFSGKLRRLGAEAVPIPSARSLETECLVNVERIIAAIKDVLDD